MLTPLLALTPFRELRADSSHFREVLVVVGPITLVGKQISEAIRPGDFDDRDVVDLQRFLDPQLFDR